MSTVTELEQRLLSVMPTNQRVAVAMSAGVDSTLVAAAAARVLGDHAVAVTAVSPSLPSGELEAAEALAREIGIRHLAMSTAEMSRPEYVQNPVNRCYFCKTELYRALEEVARRLDIDVFMNGANLDDLGDYRPGMQAAREFSVRSPLIEAQFGKADIRELARHWRLSNWDKPAGPCLSSRIAYGVEVTPERLTRVDSAEVWLRRTLNVRELRVRCEAGELARIELPLPALPVAMSEPLREGIVKELKRLGFRAVTIDLEGFRSGSMNAVVALTLPTVLTPSMTTK